VPPHLTRRALLGAVAAPYAAALAGCGGDDWAELPETSLTLATGNPGGVFAAYGDALAAVLTSRLDGVTVRTRSTDASVENLRLVAAGEADLGFSLGDTAADAVRGTGDFGRPLEVQALTRTYDSFVHLVVRDSSPVADVRDLRGLRVGVGSPGSGTRVVAQRVLRLAGLPLSRVRASSRPLQADADALADGDLDAFFFVSGLPNQAVRDLAARVPVRLVSLRDSVSAMVREHGPEYVGGPVPASTYGMRDGIDTVSVKNYLVASPGLDTGLGYAVTRVLFERQEEIDRLAPGIRQPNVSAGIFTSPLELHPGALDYFRGLRP
jgi:uncharacterized protein